MAIFSKNISTSITLNQSLDREPMSLNITVQDTLNMSQGTGRPLEKSAADTLMISQNVFRTHSEQLSAELILDQSLVATNVGRVIENVLEINSSVARDASTFGRIVSQNLVVLSLTAISKLPLKERGLYG